MRKLKLGIDFSVLLAKALQLIQRGRLRKDLSISVQGPQALDSPFDKPQTPESKLQ